MADEKHEIKRSCHSRHKWLPAAAAILLLVFLAAVFSVRYISFVSQTIYQESTYRNVDPKLGTMDDFDALAKAAHADGIKI